MKDKTLSPRLAARALLGAEAGLGLAVGAAAIAAGLPAWGAFAGVGALAYGARAVALAGLCAKAARESGSRGHPWPALPTGGVARFAARGAAIAARSHWIDSALSKRWNAQDEARDARSLAGPLIVLVPGYACGAGPLRRWQAALRSEGFAAACFEYSDAFGSIDEHAGELSDFLRIIADGREPPWLVGHSMGGLTCLRTVLDGARARGVLTVGTPLAGTNRWRSGRGRAAEQMAPDSAWLGNLKEQWTARAPARLRCAWSSCDPIVSPNVSARGDGWGAEAEYQWDGIGHLEQIASMEASARMAKLMADFQKA